MATQQTVISSHLQRVDEVSERQHMQKTQRLINTSDLKLKKLKVASPSNRKVTLSLRRNTQNSQKAEKKRNLALLDFSSDLV